MMKKSQKSQVQQKLVLGPLEDINCISNKPESIVYLQHHKQTLQRYILKLVNVADEQTFQTYIRQHLANRVQPYLARKKGISSVFTVLTTQYTKDLFFQRPETQVWLRIQRPYFKGHSLRRRIWEKNPLVGPKNVEYILANMINMSIKYGGLDNFLLTVDNIFISDIGAMSMNYTSLVGSKLLITEKYITRDEFLEIMPYLHLFIFDQNTEKRMSSMQIKLICIAVNLLSLLLQRTIQFPQLEVYLKGHVDKREAGDIVKLINGQYIRLWENINQTEWEHIHQVKNGERYLKFCQMVLCKNQGTWSKFFDLLGPTKQANSQEEEAISYLNTEYHRMASQHFLQNVPAFQRQSIQNYWKIRGFDDANVFVPIKLQMCFAKLLQYSSWLHLLLKQKNETLEGSKIVTKIFELTLQMMKKCRGNQKLSNLNKKLTLIQLVSQVKIMSEGKQKDYDILRIILKIIQDYYLRILHKPVSTTWKCFPENHQKMIILCSKLL